MSETVILYRIMFVLVLVALIALCVWVEILLENPDPTIKAIVYRAGIISVIIIFTLAYIYRQ